MNKLETIMASVANGPQKKQVYRRSESVEKVIIMGWVCAILKKTLVFSPTQCLLNTVFCIKLCMKLTSLDVKAPAGHNWLFHRWALQGFLQDQYNTNRYIFSSILVQISVDRWNCYASCQLCFDALSTSLLMLSTEYFYRVQNIVL